MLKCSRTERSSGDEDGAALVVVIIVMFALFTMAVIVAALVINTAGSVVASRSTAQSRAAADAGLAEALSTATRSGEFCSLDLTDSNPSYTVTSECPEGTSFVVFTSVGTAAGSTTRTEAVYEYAPVVSALPPDILLYSGGTLLVNEPITAPAGTLLTVVVTDPGGTLTCMGKIQGNVTIAGNFTSQSGCNVMGDVTVGGTSTSNSKTVIDGSLSVSGTGITRFAGTIGGNVWVGGALNFLSGGAPPTVGGSLPDGGWVKAGGNVTMATQTITGTLTLPSSATLDKPGQVLGEVTRQTTVPPPPQPTFDPKWFDYAPKPGFADWPADYHVVPAACSAYDNGQDAGWASLSTATQSGPVIVDLPNCDIRTRGGTGLVLTLSDDVVLVGKSFNLTNVWVKAAPGKTPKLWVITPDTTTNATPSCTGGNTVLNGTVIASEVTAMIYTPCAVDVAGQVNPQAKVADTWHGNIYSKNFTQGGALTIGGAGGMTLPGMPIGPGSVSPPPGSNEIGDKISQRDLP